MSICTKEWFSELVTQHYQMAVDVNVYVFSAFRKEDKLILVLSIFQQL